ncbi:MAG: hypothetical protein IKU39_04835 [Lachnospiraceae bacterium]|nr:hypothetical protein [Lachnospiraceae bacterium]
MMKRQRIRDFIIIVLSFGISEYFAIQVFQSEKWYVELIVYVVVFMLLQGSVSYAKRWWNKKKEDKRMGEE